MLLILAGSVVVACGVGAAVYVAVKKKFRFRMPNRRLSSRELSDDEVSAPEDWKYSSATVLAKKQTDKHGFPNFQWTVFTSPPSKTSDNQVHARSFYGVFI